MLGGVSDFISGEGTTCIHTYTHKGPTIFPPSTLVGWGRRVKNAWIQEAWLHGLRPELQPCKG